MFSRARPASSALDAGTYQAPENYCFVDRRSQERRSRRLRFADPALRGFGDPRGALGLDDPFSSSRRNTEDGITATGARPLRRLTPENAHDFARKNLAAVAEGAHPSAESHAARAGISIEEVCNWRLEQARAGRLLGRNRRPIKASTLKNKLPHLCAADRWSRSAWRLRVAWLEIASLTPYGALSATGLGSAPLTARRPVRCRRIKIIGKADRLSQQIPWRHAGRVQARQPRDQDRHDLCGLCPASPGRRKIAGGLLFVRPDLHPRQRHGEGRISERMRGTRNHFCRAGHQPARRGCSGDPANAYDFGLGAGFMSMRRKRLSRATIACGAMSPKNCRTRR